MPSLQYRKLSTNVIMLEVDFLIINMTIQIRGGISIKTGFLYAKNYLRKMF